jgi:hypothetical protein
MPRRERRSAPGAKGLGAALRRVKGVLARPVRLQLRGGQLHVVLVDRRSAASADVPLAVAQLRAELGERLLAQPPEAAQVMRHLVLVHDELGRKGWAGVEALPLALIGKALVQAEMLAGREPSAALGALVERLRALKVAAEIRAERRMRLCAEAGAAVEVSEASRDEFEATERAWTGTVPAALSRAADEA